MTPPELSQTWVEAALDAVHRDIRPLTLGDRVAAMELLAVAQSPEELREMLTASLAIRRDQHARLRELLGRVQGPTEDTRKEERAEAPPRPRVLWWLGTLAPLAGVALALAVWIGTPATEPLPPGVTGQAEEGDETDSDELWLLDCQPQLTREVEVSQLARWPDSRTPWALIAFATLVALIGGRALTLPTAQQRAQDERRKHAATRRRDAEAQALRASRKRGGRVRVHYEVPAYRPQSAPALEACGRQLAALCRAQRGQALDLPETIRATAEAAGRFIPIQQVEERPAELLVLLDVFDDTQPYLRSAEGMIASWRRMGARVRVSRFKRVPERIYDELGGERPLEEEAWAPEGPAVIVIARGLEASTRLGEPLLWARPLEAWPRRAWLDPREHLGPKEAARARRIEREAGLPRFPWTDAGLSAMLDWLRLGERDPADFAPKALRLPQDIPPGALPQQLSQEQQALVLTLGLVSLVPDATVEQLAAFRERLEEPSSGLRLLGFEETVAALRRRGGGLTGRYLQMTEAEAARNVEQLRALQRRGLVPSDTIRRGRDMLLEQLGERRPKDPLDGGNWEAKRALHELLDRAPSREWSRAERARVLQLLDSPLEAWLTDVLLAELAIWHPSHPPVHPQDVEWLRAQLLLDDDVQPLVYARSQWRAWAWGGVAAIALGAFAWAVSAPDTWPIQPGTAKVTTTGGFHHLVVGRGGVEGRRPAMACLEPGRFLMGSPLDEEDRAGDEAQHEVELTQGFMLSRTEVTQAMYERVMGENPSQLEYQGVSLIAPDYPVQNVSWLEAVAFCNALSALEGLEAAYEIVGEVVTPVAGATGYRLPTEAEWEYAARAGTQTRFQGTSTAEEACRYGNYADQSAKERFGGWTIFDCKDGVVGLAPVGKFPANAWGLHDMGGNVWEWTWDWYQRDYQDDLQRDPSGPSAGSYRVFRGGSWGAHPVYARVAFRYRWSPSVRGYYLGFRLARSLP